jgi:hypothetical protein
MSQPQNMPSPGPIKLTNGSPAFLGTITAILTQSVQFVIPEPCRDYQGFCIVMGVGNITNPTAILEGSLDGGQHWFSLNSSTNIVLGVSGLLTGDAPAGSADAFQCNGMGAGCIFRFGYTAGVIVGNINVFAMVG